MDLNSVSLPDIWSFLEKTAGFIIRKMGKTQQKGTFW
jgi:hypothetical protein